MAKGINAVVRTLVDKLRNGSRPAHAMKEKSADTHDQGSDAAAGTDQQLQDVFPISVNYDLTVEDAIDAGDYQAVNASITTRNFPSRRHGQSQLEIILVRFEGRMTSENVLTELTKNGMRAAELPEFLAFGAQYPEVQRRFSIVGLGSECRDRSGYRSVPCLYEASEGRYLDLHWWDDGWYSYSRFAAIHG